MSILVFGRTGQVAQALRVTQPSDMLVEYLGRDEADLSQPDTLEQLIRERQPSVVINAAAYTAVDLAEKELELAMRINAQSPAAMALACRDSGAIFVHYSTDYVFPGGGEKPWSEGDGVGPLSVYGRSKERGEALVRAACHKHIIFRTSWVFAAQGKNFVRTMLRLGAERETLRVVADQVGAPTRAREIAEATWVAVRTASGTGFDQWGTYHLAATGETSWFEFAQAIFADARELGFPLKVTRVEPITTAEYPTPAVRPLNSRLNGEKIKRVFGLELPHWRDSLRECLRAVKGYT